MKDVHIFSQRGLNVVIDVNSGAVHVVNDEISYLLMNSDTLDDCRVLAANQEVIDNKASRNMRWQEALVAIETLIEKGQLLTNRLAIESTHKPEFAIKAMCLHVAHDCNLRCRYCFAHTGNFGGERTLMSGDVAQQAVEFLFTSSGNRKHCEIDFFGGEPLLNMPAVRAATSLVREMEKKTGKICKLTFTTNAYEIGDDDLAWLNENNFSLVLSCDGRDSTHDRLRPDSAGLPSHARVLANIKRIIDARNGENYYVRGTYSAHNLDFAADFEFLLKNGIDKLSLEPVVSQQKDLRLEENHLPAIFQQYEKMIDIYCQRINQGLPLDFFHFNVDLTSSQCWQKIISGCGAGFQYVAVDPTGNIYPCHQFVGQADYLLGDIYRGIENWLAVERLRQRNIFNCSDCQNCWARYYCGGGCAANNYLMNGDITTQWRLGCDILRYRVQCAILAKAELKLSALRSEDGQG